MKHTPGPWEHTGNGDIQGNEDNGHGMGPVDVCSVYLRTVKGRTEANARLIAAAPALLDACIRALLLLSDPEADENEADRVTLVLVDALRLADSLDSKLELMKTNELTGAALDWAVAKAKGYDEFVLYAKRFMEMHETCHYNYSQEWEQGGPIIEREGIRMHRCVNGHWRAATDEEPQRPVTGPTPLVAAMRCYVASKLGDEVEIPDELIKEN